MLNISILDCWRARFAGEAILKDFPYGISYTIILIAMDMSFQIKDISLFHSKDDVDFTTTQQHFIFVNHINKQHLLYPAWAASSMTMKGKVQESKGPIPHPMQVAQTTSIFSSTAWRGWHGLALETLQDQLAMNNDREG